MSDTILALQSLKRALPGAKIILVAVQTGREDDKVATGSMLSPRCMPQDAIHAALELLESAQSLAKDMGLASPLLEAASECERDLRSIIAGEPVGHA